MFANCKIRYKKNPTLPSKRNSLLNQISPPKNLPFNLKGSTTLSLVPEESEERRLFGYHEVVARRRERNVSPSRRPRGVYLRPLWPHDRDGGIVRQGEGDGGEVRVCAEVSCYG